MDEIIKLHEKGNDNDILEDMITEKEELVADEVQKAIDSDDGEDYDEDQAYESYKDRMIDNQPVDYPDRNNLY